MISDAFNAYAARLGFPGSKTMLSILELLFPDPVSQQVFAALSKKPSTVDEVAAATGLSESEVAETAARLVKSGALGKYPKPSEKLTVVGGMIELRDSTVIDPEISAELINLWEQLLNVEMDVVAPAWRAKNHPPKMRVIAVEKSIPSQNVIVDIDSVRNILLEADLITASPCPCRVQAAKAGRSQKCPAPKDLNLCMQTNKFAMLMEDRGIGEVISSQEALSRLEAAENAGLVHQIRNNVKKDMIICNCCSCCCSARLITDKVDMVAKSRFQVELDPSLCNGCTKCVKVCIYNVITVDRNRPKEERVAEFNIDKCFGCGNCAIICPKGAVSLKEVRPPEHVRNT